MAIAPLELNYPEELPVVARRDVILDALRRSPVVIISGDTGSGKTTQLPKMALELGRGAKGRRIAVTQPRRLAALTMAERVAAELKEPVGETVGYQHRFGRCLSPRTRVKFMTEGVLLAETAGDPLLRAYDTIIVDEAHERSLNVDFLLGILKRLLERRSDLKVVISSATLDICGFASFFDGAPVIEVPGRLFPVEIVYRPPPSDEELDLPREVAAALAELPSGDDTLVFLSGERDIRDTAERLKGAFPDSEIIPLLASLPASEQRRAFRLADRRRVILATNVAETSVTIPGIRAVIDSGVARLSRFVHRTQVQRLQVEPISQASARQRAGRCGRIGPGICIRLYSQEDFAMREEFTPPEILRSSLAGVILTMLDLRLGQIDLFPFIDPPRGPMIREGMAELLELGAVETDANGLTRLTAVGRKLARVPVEPRLARMMLAASSLATLPSALPVIAALATEDPRRRPVDERDRATAAHAKFKVPDSDFLGVLKLWNWWLDSTNGLSQAKVRRLCQSEYLSYPKFREWRDLVRQLRDLAQRLGLDVKNDNGGPDALHRALLTGLLGRIGRWDVEEREYRGARGIRFTLHPSSSLAKHPPQWVMAGELVDTSRLFARFVAAIDVRWIEDAAGELCRRSYHSQMWDAERGFVRATEQVVLYGLVIVPARRRDYSRIDPVLSRDLFLRFGLVGGEFPRPLPAVRANLELIAELRRRAEKLRRPELFDEQALVASLDRSIPRDVCSADALRKWLRMASAEEIAAFKLRREDWIGDVSEGPEDFPDFIRIGEVTMALSYRHDRDGGEEDGITCTVRRGDAAALRLWRADWLVPGALRAKLVWMVGALPSALRKVLTPIDDTVAGLLAKLKPGSEPLEDAVRRTVREEWGFRIPDDAWSRVKMPEAMRVRYRILDDSDGHELAVSRDLGQVLASVGLSAADASVPCAENERHVSWDFGEIPESTADTLSSWNLRHYPALHDEGDAVTLRLYADSVRASSEHAAGVARLYALALRGKLRAPFRLKGLPFAVRAFLANLHSTDDALSRDLLEGAVWETLVRGREPVRTAAEFAKRLSDGMPEIVRTHANLARLFQSVVTSAAELSLRLDTDGRIPEETATAVAVQLAWLVYPGFVRTLPQSRLVHFARYLKAASVRLDRARINLAGDRSKEARFAPYWERYRAAAKAGRAGTAAMSEYRWLLEEYRVSLFAQELKTPVTVSPQRLDELWDLAVGKGCEHKPSGCT